MLVTTRAYLDRMTRWVILASYIAAFLALLASLFWTFEGQLWVGPIGDVSSISVGSVSVIYALSQYRFKSVGYSGMKSIVLGVLFANAFLQCYELIYGMTFSLSAVLNDPPTLTGTDVRTFLLWLIMISPILLVHEHLRFKWTSAALLSLTGAVWVVWILYGFPQYYYSGYAFAQVLKTSDPYHLSLWLNFGSKALLAVFFVSLLEPLKPLKAALGRR
ncbi:MAG: hypothetical protein OK441_07315 [Thaumarchaeota archaeon]|nr:hypothetical protein [Nitrososphaerota archaeon]